MSAPYPSPFTLLPDALHFKEFYGGFTGTCGETALTAAIICALRLGESHDQAVQMMLDITREMQAHGWADANGASTVWSLAREAVLRHATIALEYDYQEPLAQDWHAVLLANAGVKPIVMEVGLAENLVGQDNSGNDEAGVHYHFITVVGKCPDGYICMDGDNWKIEQQFAIYSYATLQAADICGLLMLDEVPPMPIPANWKDNGSVLTAPNGKTVVHGFRDHILAGAWNANLQPLDEEHGVGVGVVEQDFGLKLHWTSATNVTETAGEVVGDPNQVAQLEAEVKTLQAEIDALKAQKTNPAIVAALDALNQYLGAQVQLAKEVAAAEAVVVR